MSGTPDPTEKRDWDPPEDAEAQDAPEIPEDVTGERPPPPDAPADESERRDWDLP